MKPWKVEGMSVVGNCCHPWVTTFTNPTPWECAKLCCMSSMFCDAETHLAFYFRLMFPNTVFNVNLKRLLHTHILLRSHVKHWIIRQNRNYLQLELSLWEQERLVSWDSVVMGSVGTPQGLHASLTTAAAVSCPSPQVPERWNTRAAAGMRPASPASAASSPLEPRASYRRRTRTSVCPATRSSMPCSACSAKRCSAPPGPLELLSSHPCHEGVGISALPAFSCSKVCALISWACDLVSVSKRWALRKIHAFQSIFKRLWPDGRGEWNSLS